MALSMCYLIVDIIADFTYKCEIARNFVYSCWFGINFKMECKSEHFRSGRPNEVDDDQIKAIIESSCNCSRD